MSVYTPLSIGRLCPLELHMEIQEKHLMLVSYVKDFFYSALWLLLKKVTDFHKEK